MNQIIELPIDQIKPQTLQRQIHPDEVSALMESIKAVGIMSPLTVNKLGDEYFLVAGKHRLAAAKGLGLPTVPCLITEGDQDLALSMTLHENMFRKDLNVVEEAQNYEYMANQLHYSNRKIAEMIGKSESYVSQRLNLLAWPKDLVDALKQDHINFSVARELSMIDHPQTQKFYLNHAISEGANYRIVRVWRQHYEANKESDAPPTDPNQIPNPPQQQYHTFGQCFWCNQPVDIDKIVIVHLCPDDYLSLMGAKEKAENETKP